MYLLLILLISPALGRPSSDQLHIGAEISKQLDDLVDFSRETGKLLNNPEIFETVSESLERTDQSILAMEAVLDDLRSQIPALQDQKNSFRVYIEAKSLLRQTRQELNELAHRTVKEVGIMMSLLDDLDNSKIPFLLEAAIDRMKLLMEVTKKQLVKAKKIYNEARLALENLRVNLKSQQQILQSAILYKQEQFEIDEEYTNEAIYNCKWAAVFTLGLCPFINHLVNVIPLERERRELEALNDLTPAFLKKALALNEDMVAAVKVMDKEIDLINKWAVSAQSFSKIIKDYPEEALRVFGPLRTNFIRGLVDLKMNAQNFLDL